MNPDEQRQAYVLYCRWFAKYPTVKNPTDVNSRVKYDFAVQVGWEKLSLMLRARKANTAANGYPYPWTKPEYWNEAIETDCEAIR